MYSEMQGASGGGGYSSSSAELITISGTNSVTKTIDASKVYVFTWWHSTTVNERNGSFSVINNTVTKTHEGAQYVTCSAAGDTLTITKIQAVGYIYGILTTIE